MMNSMKLNQKSTKATFIVLALLMLLPIVLFFPNQTYAVGNVSDTSFYVSNANGNQTSIRGKWDYTSSYMKNTAIMTGTRYNAVSVGRMSALPGENWNSYGAPSYTFTSGTTRYMINYVKENGCGYCSILTNSVPGYGSYTASGWWSPDSV